MMNLTESSKSSPPPFIDYVSHQTQHKESMRSTSENGYPTWISIWFPTCMTHKHHEVQAYENTQTYTILLDDS